MNYKIGPHGRVKQVANSGSARQKSRDTLPLENSKAQLISFINSVSNSLLEKDLDGAIKSAKDALREAKLLDGTGKSNGSVAVPDSCSHLLEEIFYGYIKRECAAEGKVPEMRDRLAKELPDLCNTELNHQLKDAMMDVDTHQLRGEISEALKLARENADIAEPNGLLYVAQEFRMKIFHLQLDRALRTEGNLDEAIGIMKQLLGFVKIEGIRTPAWMYEEAYWFAYSGDASANYTPRDVRDRIRNSIPELPTNNYGKMGDLELWIRRTMEDILAKSTGGSADRLVGAAFEIIELSFLSPPEIYDGKRKTIRTLFENFAAGYLLRYAAHAKNDGYGFESLENALEKRVPDLFASNERLGMGAGFRTDIGVRCAEAEEKLEDAIALYPQTAHVTGNLTFAWQLYVNAARLLNTEGEYALAARADILAERINALENAFQNASQKGTAIPAVAAIEELQLQAAEFGKLFA